MTQLFLEFQQTLREVFNKSQSICSLVVSYYLPYPFIDYKCTSLDDLFVLQGNSSRFTNMVSTREGFVFLRHKQIVFYLTPSFSWSNNLILIPPLASDSYGFLDLGLVPQVLQTTWSANRVVVIWLYTRNYGGSILYFTLCEYKNSIWSQWMTSFEFPFQVEVRNIVHLADVRTILFNWKSEHISLLSYNFNENQNKYIFSWQIDKYHIPGLDANVPVHSFGVWNHRIMILVAIDYGYEFRLFDLEIGSKYPSYYGSFNFLYGFPSCFPSVPRKSITRIWDVHYKDLIHLKGTQEITYWMFADSQKYHFALPLIPFKNKESLEILLGGSSMFVLRSDTLSLLFSF